MKAKHMVRVKSVLVHGWETMTLDHMWRMMNKFPQYSFEVKIACDHKRVTLSDGEKRCAKCNELIEVMSYRD